MRIFCPYTDVQNATMTALSLYLIDAAVFVDVSREWAYLDYLDARWADGKTFINIEHDVVPWLGAFEQLWECSHDWCFFQYASMPGEAFCPPPAIGLVKFTDKLIRRLPRVWTDWREHYDEYKAVPGVGPSYPWNHLDWCIYQYAKARGVEPHQHWPSVVNAKPTSLPFDQHRGVLKIGATEPYVEPRLNYDLERYAPSGKPLLRPDNPLFPKAVSCPE